MSITQSSWELTGNADTVQFFTRYYKNHIYILGNLSWKFNTNRPERQETCITPVETGTEGLKRKTQNKQGAGAEEGRVSKITNSLRDWSLLVYGREFRGRINSKLVDFKVPMQILLEYSYSVQMFVCIYKIF